MVKVFIDGKAGTTGLRIFDRLSCRKDIELLTLNDNERKNSEMRREMINSSDISFLCLPDDAAREAVSFVTGNTKIIDTSTAHRTLDGWSYGFPELSQKHWENIVNGKRIAVPGCHASGFASLMYPLIKSGVLSVNYPITSFSITGYSGGGKKMIAEYQSENKDVGLDSPSQYALSQNHKHLKEMQKICGFANAPIFSPIVSNFYSGMAVSVPLFTSMLKRNVGVEEIKEILTEHYDGSKLIKVTNSSEQDSMIAANKLSGKDTMQLVVSGNEERVILTSLFDNLGKGASGAAVECMNLMLGIDETTGLEL
ncbi:MAG TPA: N-acetyl-gamma-glutamyl-phosphate reductase [Clostridia bacterium]|nr:N-acetyl-gamma-glutamyl-phosphate reductase [Clostridia bacterium]